MLKVRRPIVVEGRYDRIRLSSVIDGVILETGGFRIFKDKEMLEALRHLARTTGLILLTDSDQAGFRIRNFLRSALAGTPGSLRSIFPESEGWNGARPPLPPRACSEWRAWRKAFCWKPSAAPASDVKRSKNPAA